MRESAAAELVRDFQSMQYLGLLGKVFDIALSVTSLMGHLGNLASCSSLSVSLNELHIVALKSVFNFDSIWKLVRISLV